MISAHVLTLLARSRSSGIFTTTAPSASSTSASIGTAEALRQLGSREAWLRIQAIDESACIHRLLALEGAIRGVRKAELPEDVRAELREFYRRHKK